MTEVCLPFTELLGNLRQLEVYVYYDGPKLFTCQSGVGQVYLSVWLDDGEEHDYWLLAPLSIARFDQLRVGQLDLRTVFTRPEDGIVFRLAVSRRTGTGQAEPILPDTLSDDMLPEPDQYLPVTADAVPPALASLTDPTSVAKQVWRHALDLRLRLPARYGYRAPVRELATLLLPLQDTVDAIVYGSGVDLAQRGRLPVSMLGHTELSWQMNYPSSFGMVLTATEQADLFGNSIVAPALARLVELVDCGSDRARLTDHLQNVHQRAATRYARFLGSLLRANAELDISWVTPEEDRQTATMSLQVAREALEIVNQVVLQMPEETTVVGLLVGLNIRLRTFEVSETTSGKRYSGRIAEIAMPSAEHATINDTYTARIEKIVEVSPMTGTEIVRWQLVGLLPPSIEEPR
jgi:hypothetical protein